MNILIVSHTFPFPPDEGIKSPLYNLIKEFSKKNSVSLLSFIKENETEYIKELEKYCDKIFVIKHFISRNFIIRAKSVFCDKEPYFVKQFFSTDFMMQLENITKQNKYDTIFFDFINTVIYRKMLNNIFNKTRFVLHLHDAMSMLFYRNYLVENNILHKYYWYNQYRKLLMYENNLQKLFDKITVVSKVDKMWLVEKSQIDDTKIEIIPNGVDFDYYKPIYVKEDFPSVIFRGIMNFKPNIDGCLFFYKKILPIIRKYVPETKFYVVGPNPPNKIKKIVKHKLNIVTGYVNDIREYIAKTTINVSPMISGSGIKNKILESMSMEKPSVITPLAAEGIPELKDGENVLISDNETSFAQNVIRLFNLEELRKKIGINARKVIIKNYSWSFVANKFIKIFEE